jgi:hypothetical protein
MELWTGIACLAGDPNCKDFRRFGDQGRGAYVNMSHGLHRGRSLKIVSKRQPKILTVLSWNWRTYSYLSEDG